MKKIAVKIRFFFCEKFPASRWSAKKHYNILLMDEKKAPGCLGSNRVYRVSQTIQVMWWLLNKPWNKDSYCWWQPEIPFPTTWDGAKTRRK